MSVTSVLSIAYVTVPSREIGLKISRSLVKNNLAACVSIIPQIKSIYKWENNIEENDELLLMIKTRSELVSKLTDEIKLIHPYKVPEIISTPIDPTGNQDYLKWILEETKEAK